jgi:hypothetical protein
MVTGPTVLQVRHPLPSLGISAHTPCKNPSLPNNVKWRRGAISEQETSAVSNDTPIETVPVNLLLSVNMPRIALVKPFFSSRLVHSVSIFSF